MKLPVVDQSRRPFIEPFGHLAMQAAYAEARLIDFCATPVLPDAPSIGTAAKKIRHWDEAAKNFAIERAQKISHLETRDEALEAIRRYDELHRSRNRAIHDALEVGIDGDDQSGYAIVTLGAENIADRKNRPGDIHYYQQLPEHIADLACKLEDVHKTFEFIIWKLER